MYNWIESTFNVSGGITQAIAVVLALAVVLLLFGLFIFILKRLMGANTQQNRSRQPRIAVMDSAPVDTRRRLILIRRDNVEHLILVGGPSDVVVEQNIVRNAPLASARPGSYPAPGHTGAGQVKTPMAPGPDIPITPEDMAPQTDPLPVAAQAAAAISPPAPAAAPAPVAAPAPSAPSAPAASRPRPAERMQPVPSAARASQPAAAPATVAVRAEPQPETGEGSSRAADLLRAATQNGFNRAFSRPGPSVPAQQAPDVKPDPAAGRDEAAVSVNKAGGSLGSLPRSFTSRERPSYGGHSITPPASGPAARAKTALLKPVDPAQAPQKIEPVVAAPAVAKALDIIPSADAPEADADEMTGKAPDTEQPVPAEAQAEEPVTGPIDEADRETGAPEDKPVDTSGQEDEVEATSGELVETAPDEAEAPAQEPEKEQAQIQAQTQTGPASSSADSVQRDIELDLEDIVDEPEETAPEPKADSAEAAPEPSPEDTSSEEAAEEKEEDRPSDETRAPEVRLRDDQVKPAPRPSAGLGDKNPIEEEMAKILDELGGQSNR